MLRVTKFFSSLALVLVIVWFGVLNTQSIELNTFPLKLGSDGLGKLKIPMFLIVLISIFFGFILGCILEYIRASKLRRCLKEKNKNLKETNMQLKNLKRNLELEDDEILSLLK